MKRASGKRAISRPVVLLLLLALFLAVFLLSFMPVHGVFVSGTLTGEEPGASATEEVHMEDADSPGINNVGSLQEITRSLETRNEEDDRGNADAGPVVADDANAAGNQVIHRSISGTVTGEEEGNPPLERCLVVAYGTFCDSYDSYIREAKTDSSGNYRIEDLQSGEYYVKFIPRDNIHLSLFYNDRPDMESADLVTVTFPDETRGIDAVLAVGASISGTVTEDLPGATPIEGCHVEVCDAATGYFIGSANTDPSGNYRIGSLPTGSYVVSFWSDGTYHPERYDDKDRWYKADVISVVAPVDNITGIDASLAPGTLAP